MVNKAGICVIIVQTAGCKFTKACTNDMLKTFTIYPNKKKSQMHTHSKTLNVPDYFIRDSLKESKFKIMLVP